jgi:PAS domain S-box-containing protein
MTRHGHLTTLQQCNNPSDPGDVLVPLSALERTVDSGHLGFAKIDVATGRVVSANSWFCSIVGFTWQEMVERQITTRDLTYPADLEKCIFSLRRLIAKEINSCTIDNRYVRKDRSLVPLRVTMTVLERSGDNTRVLSIGIIASPLTAIAEASPSKCRGDAHGVSFWSYDFASRTGNCSEGFLLLLGLSADAPVPKFRACLAQVHPDDQLRVLNDMQRVKKGVFNSTEFRLYRANGELCWVSQALKPVIDSIGEVVGAVGACLDITDAKRIADHSPFAYTVQTVRLYVDQHWDQPLSVTELAKVAGVNTRTLFKHFKLACAYTPQEYIKRVRLNHARAMLQMADRSTTVLGTALKCCFQNQGHFARDYRLAFGERPSDTLERARRRDVP